MDSRLIYRAASARMSEIDREAERRRQLRQARENAARDRSIAAVELGPATAEPVGDLVEAPAARAA
jgi:hypothetical protein